MPIPGESTIKGAVTLNVQQNSVCNQWVDTKAKSVFENLLDQIVCDDINQAVFVKQRQLCQTQR